VTAYFACSISKAKSGETVVVSAAAGSSGFDRRPDRQIRGCHVVGHRRRQEKCHGSPANSVSMAVDYKEVPPRHCGRRHQSIGRLFRQCSAATVWEACLALMNNRGRIAAVARFAI